MEPKTLNEMSPEEIRARISEQVKLQSEQALMNVRKRSRTIMIFTFVFVVIMILVLLVVKLWI